MSRIGLYFGDLARNVENFSVEALSKNLPPEWIQEALQKADPPRRRVRKLPGNVVVWLVVAMGLFRNLSILNVVRKLGCPLGAAPLWGDQSPPTSSAVTQARDRLGVAAVQQLFKRFANSLLGRFGSQMAWHGMPLVGIDGTTFKVPDSNRNREFFGLPAASRGRTAFPQMRGVLLWSATHHFVLDAALAPYRTGEITLAPQLIESMPDDSLVLLDRNFGSFQFLNELTAHGRHFLVRAKWQIKTRRTGRLGAGDWRVEIDVRRQLRKEHPDLPEKLSLREIVCDTGGQEPLRFFTDLLDPNRFGATDLIELYRSRWEMEISLDEIKVHQGAMTCVNRPVILRSMTPERIMQETFGLLLAYNLVRSTMAEAAQHEAEDCLSISFVGALECIREAVPQMAAAPTTRLPALYGQLLRRIATLRLPPRRKRHNRREVCVKMSSYPLKRKRHVA